MFAIWGRGFKMGTLGPERWRAFVFSLKHPRYNLYIHASTSETEFLLISFNVVGYFSLL